MSKCSVFVILLVVGCGSASSQPTPAPQPTPQPLCGSFGAACSTMNDCCQGSTCPRYGTVCALGSIGDPCQQNADCHTNLVCNGLWCTKSCVSNADCGATNYCIHTAQNFVCFPFCNNSNADCSIYPGTSCKTGMDPSNAVLPVCAN